jgi:hypothetical protein
MVHLRIFYTALRESGFLELPIKMISTIFKHMTESGFVIWISKIVKDGLPQRHIYYVSEAVEIWRGADDDTARPQNIPETSECDVARYWQVLDDFRKKNEVEFDVKRRLRFT